MEFDNRYQSELYSIKKTILLDFMASRTSYELANKKARARTLIQKFFHKYENDCLIERYKVDALRWVHDAYILVLGMVEP